MSANQWLVIVALTYSLLVVADRDAPAQEPASPRPSAKDKSVLPSRHLASIFSAAARQREKLAPIHERGSLNDSDFDRDLLGNRWALYTDHVASHFLPRSLPLEALALEVQELSEGTEDERARARSFLELAAERTRHADPQQRALGSEFLGMVPMMTLESGLITSIATLLADDEIAFPSIYTTQGQAWNSGTIATSQMSVGFVASSSIASLTPFRFESSETFRGWWQSHQNVRSHPWFWLVRWQKLPAENDLELLATLGIDEGLRMLLYVRDDLAVEREARRLNGFEERSRNDGDVRDHGKTLENVRPITRYVPASMAAPLYVYRHRLNSRLLDIIAGQPAWFRESNQVAMRIQGSAVRVVAETATDDDLPRIERMLESPQGALEGNLELQIRLTRLIANKLPDRSEAILVKQLERHPGYHLLACDLLQQTGFKHWELIKKSYGTASRGHDRSRIITAVQQTSEASARTRLAELFAMDDLTALEPNADLLRGVRFWRFAEAAEAIQGEPVVTAEEVREARYDTGKGGDDPERDKLVPENRRKALDKLRAFFGSVR